MTAVQQYSIKGRRREGGKKESDVAFLPEGGNLVCRIDMNLSDSP